MRQRKLIFGLGIIALLGPFWITKLQEAFGQRFFLSPDSVALLGITLLTGLIAVYFFPDSTVSLANKCIQFVRSNFVWVSSVFVLLLFISLIVINRHVFKSFFSSADEYSCYFLAECIRDGKWWVTPHPLSDFFETVHVGTRDGKWFSVYPPGWPLLFALGLRFNIGDWMNPIMTVF